MPTSNEQLRAWTTQGAQDAARATYASVRAALSSSHWLTGLDYEVFLQGSYANHTNTRGDSDVDIVVMLTSTFTPDTGRLTPSDRLNHAVRKVPGTTSAQDFRGRVHRALSDYYGSYSVQSKNKCLRIPRSGGRVDADVVPCLQQRAFTTYPVYGTPKYLEGISIQPLEGARIVNYPKLHKSNGEEKNARASQAYKPTVRQIKRLRRAGVEQELIRPDQAPGYLLECMAFNAPDYLFLGDEADRVRAVIRWLDQRNIGSLISETWSCDRVHRLFVDDPGGHDPTLAKRTLATLRGMLA